MLNPRRNNLFRGERGLQANAHRRTLEVYAENGKPGRGPYANEHTRLTEFRQGNQRASNPAGLVAHIAGKAPGSSAIQ